MFYVINAAPFKRELNVFFVCCTQLWQRLCLLFASSITIGDKRMFLVRDRRYFAVHYNMGDNSQLRSWANYTTTIRHCAGMSTANSCTSSWCKPFDVGRFGASCVLNIVVATEQSEWSLYAHIDRRQSDKRTTCSLC